MAPNTSSRACGRRLSTSRVTGSGKVVAILRTVGGPGGKRRHSPAAAQAGPAPSVPPRSSGSSWAAAASSTALRGLSVQTQSVQPQQCRELRRSRNLERARIRNHRHAPAGNTVDSPDQCQRPFGVAARELLEGSEPGGAAVQGLDMDLQLTAAGEPDGERVLAAEAKSLKAGAAVGHYLQRRGNHGTLNTAAGEAAEDFA